MTKLRIDIWSDIACPWCYVGKRRLEQALVGFPHAGEVAIVWRAFELDPSAPRARDRTQSHAERLARKYGMSLVQAQARIDHLVSAAAKDGLAMRFDIIQSGNTFDGHRLLHLAHDRGVQDALKERLMRAQFCEGEAIGDPEVLVRLAREVGLDDGEVEGVLAGDRYAGEVRQDEAIARELGITGVPFFVLGGRFGVSGAQPPEVLRNALDRAWEQLHTRASDELVEGAVCGPDGCD